MKKNQIHKIHKQICGSRGFTLIEVVISIALFTYIFGAIVSFYIMFNGNILRNQKHVRCSSFAKIMIQNLLTNSDQLEISTSTNELYFKRFDSADYEIVRAENSDIFLLNSRDSYDFNATGTGFDFKRQFQIDNCGGNKIYLEKSVEQNISSPSIINKTKCINLQYLDIVSVSTSTEKICALF